MSKRARGVFTSVKITDVAAAAGVAPMTVSRVLNTPDRVSPETTLRVQAAIERLGYVPNLIAGGLSSRRSRMVAAVVPTIASPMFADPVQTFTDTLARAGYHVMLALSGYGEHVEEPLVRALLSRRPDGLLLTGAARTAAVRRLLSSARIPVVEIWDVAAEHTDMLAGFNHADVGRAVASHFAAQGHTNFAVLHASDERALARRRGFAEGVAQHGGRLVAERRLPAPAGITDARGALRAIAPELRAAGRTALFGSSDLVAFGAVTEARALTLSVPDDLAVCGFGDFELSRGSVPTLTTVQVDGQSMGRIAAEQLLSRITPGHATSVESHVVIPFRIIDRAST